MIVGIVNQKGGVGKTTCAINMTLEMLRLGHRVLLVDADPQGSITSIFSTNDKSAGGVVEMIDPVFLGTTHSWSQIHDLSHITILKVDVKEGTTMDFLKMDSERFVSQIKNMMCSEENIGRVRRAYFRKRLQLLAKEFKYEYVIVDLAGTTEDTNKVFALSCDAWIVPTFASALDLSSTSKFLTTIQNSWKKWHIKELAVSDDTDYDTTHFNFNPRFPEVLHIQVIAREESKEETIRQAFAGYSISISVTNNRPISSTFPIILTEVTQAVQSVKEFAAKTNLKRGPIDEETSLKKLKVI